METVALRPLRVGEIIDVAIKLYRSNFATLIRIVVFVTAPAQVLLILVQASTRANFDTSNFNQGFEPNAVDPDIDAKALAAGAIGLLAVSMLGWLTGEIASAACFRVVGGAYLDETQTWQESLRYAVKRLRSLLWLSICKIVLMALGLLLCIVPGVYLYGAFAVSTPALMLEGARGGKALRRSRELVNGRWWPTAGVLLIGTILTSIVGGAISALAAGLVFTGNDVAVDVARGVGGVVGSTLTTPILASIITVLYIDLRVRKEGFDLELLAETVGIDPSRAGALRFLPDAPGAGSGGDDQPPFWPPPPGWRPKSDA